MIITIIFHKFAPMVVRRQKETKCPPWLTNQIKNLNSIRKRNRLHRCMCHNRTNNFTQRYTEFRSKVEKEIKVSKRCYSMNKYMTCIGESRQLYQFLNLLRENHNNSNSIRQMNNKNGVLEKASEKIADNFNNFFCKCGGNTDFKYTKGKLRIPEPLMSIILYPAMLNQNKKL